MLMIFALDKLKGKQDSRNATAVKNKIVSNKIFTYILSVQDFRLEFREAIGMRLEQLIKFYSSI